MNRECTCTPREEPPVEIPVISINLPIFMLLFISVRTKMHEKEQIFYLANYGDQPFNNWLYGFQERQDSPGYG
jgi:hypothetical protein